MTTTEELRIKRAFRKDYESASIPMRILNADLQLVEEHDQLWIRHRPSGGEWSVNEAEVNGEPGYAFECVTQPDEESERSKPMNNHGRCLTDEQVTELESELESELDEAILEIADRAYADPDGDNDEVWAGYEREVRQALEAAGWDEDDAASFARAKLAMAAP